LKHIGILELHYHIKYLYTTAKIFKTKKTDVTIFVTKEIYDKLSEYLKNMDEYKFVIKKTEESIDKYLKRIEKKCSNDIDILFVNTIQKSMIDLPHYKKFNPDCKKILTIHVANSWFSSKPGFDLRKFHLTLDSHLSTYYAKKHVLLKYDGINVIYPPIKQWIRNNTDYQKPIYTIPFGFCEENKFEKTKNLDKNVFVVPGQIQEHRRDYNIVFDIFERLFDKHNNKIKLILLGYPVGSYGERIQNRFKNLRDKGFDIEFFKDFVPEKIYNDKMKNVDFIFLPIQIKSRGLGVTPEWYGKSKGSAAFFEGVNYRKPMILPDEFNVLKEFNSSIIKYKHIDDLEIKINNLLKETGNISSIKNEAIKNSEYFSLKNLQNYFIKNILEDN